MMDNVKNEVGATHPPTTTTTTRIYYLFIVINLSFRAEAGHAGGPAEDARGHRERRRRGRARAAAGGRRCPADARRAVPAAAAGAQVTGAPVYEMYTRPAVVAAEYSYAFGERDRRKVSKQREGGSASGKRRIKISPFLGQSDDDDLM